MMEPIKKPELPSDFGEYNKETNTHRAKEYGERCIYYGIELAIRSILDDDDSRNKMNKIIQDKDNVDISIEVMACKIKESI